MRWSLTNNHGGKVMTEKRKFKVLWFTQSDGTMRINARTCFRVAAEAVGANDETDFEHHFVLPLLFHNEVAWSRAKTEKWDLVMVSSLPIVKGLVWELCEAMDVEHLKKVVLWDVKADEFNGCKLQNCPRAYYFEHGFDHCVKTLRDVLAAAKR